MPRDLSADLEEKVNDPNSRIEYSSHGSGGAILMPGGNVGLAVKVEGPDTTMDAGRLGKMMDGFFQESTGEAPFFAPQTAVFAAGELEAESLLTRLGTVVPGEGREQNADTAKENLQGFNAGGDAMVTIQEFAPGVQLNKLDDNVKLQLLQSPEFAQQMGRAMPLIAAVGLGGHLSTSMTAHLNNPSNFMYDVDTETLSVIDFATNSGVDPSGIAHIADPIGRINDLKAHVAAAANGPEQLQGLMNGALRNNIEGLGMAVDAFVANTGHGDDFASAGMEAQITQQMKEQFTANLVAGMADGLEYLAQNEEALRNAAQGMHTQDADGNTIEHFYTNEQINQIGTVMNDIRNEISGAKLDILKNNIERLSGNLTPKLKTLKEDEKKLENALREQNRGLLNKIQNKWDPGERNELKRQLKDVRSQIKEFSSIAQKAMMQHELAQAQGGPNQEQPAAAQAQGGPNQEQPAAAQAQGGPNQEQPAAAQAQGGPNQEQPAAAQAQGGPNQEQPAAAQAQGGPNQEQPAAAQAQGGPNQEQPAAAQAQGGPNQEQPAASQEHVRSIRAAAGLDRGEQEGAPGHGQENAESVSPGVQDAQDRTQGVNVQGEVVRLNDQAAGRSNREAAGVRSPARKTGQNVSRGHGH